MKKAITILLTLLTALQLVACGTANNTYTTPSQTSTTTATTNSKESTEFTDDKLTKIACTALYKKLLSTKTKAGVLISNYYNIDSTKYSIGSIKENSSGGWTVKGTFSLYNDYGEFRKKGTFDVKISSSGDATCTLTID